MTLDDIMNHLPAKATIDHFVRRADGEQTLLLQGPEAFGKTLVLKWIESHYRDIVGLSNFRADADDFFDLVERVADLAPVSCGNYQKTRRKHPLQNNKLFSPKPTIKVSVNAPDSQVNVRHAGATDLLRSERSFRARLYVEALRKDLAEQNWSKPRVIIVESFDRSTQEFQKLFARFLAGGLACPEKLKFVVATRLEAARAFDDESPVALAPLGAIKNPDDVIAFWGGALAGKTDAQTRTIAASLITDSGGNPQTLALLARATRNALVSANEDQDGVSR